MRGSMRPTWDETWMQVARVMALRAPCSRDRVGAVIVDPSNRVVATGYNGPPADLTSMGTILWEYECDGSEGGSMCQRGKFGPTTDSLTSYVDCPSIHAEANALMFCDRREREGGTIYITGYMCWTCTKLVANSGLRRVVMIGSDSFNYRTPSDSLDFLSDSAIDVTIIKEDNVRVR